MDLYVYENFELQGMITQYDYLKWIRRYNDVGEFEIEMPFSQEMFSLLKINNVLYHRQNNEACFILQKNVTTDSFGNEKLLVYGKCISCILKDRFASYEGSSTLKNIITGLLNSNFISASNTNRRIPSMVIGSMDLKNNPVINVEYENVEVYTILKEIAQQSNIGFKINYDIPNKRYSFELYEGEIKTDVMFSKTFNNVIEQEYYLNTQDHKNTCIVRDNEGNITIVNDGNKGLARKEVYTTLNTQSTDTATQQGELYLQQFRKVETMDTVMDTSSIQFEYLKDWNLGDIVTTINKKLNVTIQKNVVEIEEFYDSTGLNLAVTFGDYFFTSPSGGSGGGSSGGGSASGLDGKDGSDGADGISLQYQWNGTQLGIKREDETSYQYTNLKGEKGEQGIQGIQGGNGADGHTPIKGIDYFDGKDGLTTAVKLGTTQYTHVNGVISLPSYPTTLPANGGNSTTVNGYTVNSNVPSGAKFTDTVYTHPSTHPSTMIIGLSPIATSGSYSDLINQPTIPTKTSQLTNDSGYITSIPSHNHDDRYYTETEIDSLLLSKVNTDGNKKLSTEDYTSAEKTKLSSIAEGANNYTHPPTHPSSIIVDSAEKRFVTDNEKETWNLVVDKVDKVEGKQLSDNNFTSTEKTKLSGIANNANNYSHPSSHPASMITGLSSVATTGSYSDLENKPNIPQKTSDLTNDNGFLSSLPSHNHDDRYYTESEIDTKLNGKANASHTHTKSQITDFPSIPTDTNQLNKSDVYTKMEVDVALTNKSTITKKTFILPATSGWYRIAQSPVNTGQASGLIDIVWNSADGHEGHNIASVSSWGNTTPMLTQLLCMSSNSTSHIYNIRVVRPSTTSGNRAYLEVLLQYAQQTTIEVALNNNLGWEFVDVINGSVPSGYSSYSLYFFRHIPISTSNTNTCYNLNAKYLGGYNSGNFQRKYTTTSALPTPSSTYRNQFYWLNKSGEDGKCYMGIRQSNSTYAFREIATTEYVNNLISDSGGGDGALIFDKLANQIGVKVNESKSGSNYITQVRQNSSNLLLADKTESKNSNSYITTIRIYESDGSTIKQTITITESKNGSNYETTII